MNHALLNHPVAHRAPPRLVNPALDAERAPKGLGPTGLGRIGTSPAALERAERERVEEEPQTAASEVQPPVEAAPSVLPRAAVENEGLKRALEDLEAAESRVERNAQRLYDETRAKLVNDLLPVLDNLDRTVRAGRGTSDHALVDGVEMIRAQLAEVLHRYGAERIDAMGERFDPTLHHAIAMVHTEPGKMGFVVDDVEAGYRFAGKVLRPAKVVVGTH